MEQYQSSIVKTVDKSQLTIHPALSALWQSLHYQGIGLFVVGGAVRDLLSGLQPHEYDFASDLPMADLMEQAKACGLKATVISQELEVVVLKAGEQAYEVARMRLESHYPDGRHPTQVVFTPSMHIDSHRRDFTINGLYLDYLGNIFDFHQGYKDLLDGVLKPIGAPKLKMSQDALRLLRGLRMATLFGLKIQPDLLCAMQSLDYTLPLISMERRMDELRRILTHTNWHRGLSLLESCGFLKCGYYLSPVSTQLKASIKPNAFSDVFAMLLSLQGNDWTADLSERLSHYALTRDEKTQVTRFIRSYNLRKQPLDILFQFGEHHEILHGFFAGFKDPEVQELMGYLQQCQDQGMPLKASELHITPKRLLELGVEGNRINPVRYALFLGVHRGFYLNTNFDLEGEVKRLMSFEGTNSFQN